MNRRNHLFYHSEGTCFMEALPLGNGRIGAMVYGGAVEEKIQVDESTFWSGEHSEKNDIPGMQERLWELRKTLQKKDYEEADRIGKDFIGNKQNYGTNLPTGNLILRNLTFEKEKVTGYERSLDIRDSVVEVSYGYEESTFSRKIFVSNPAQVLVIRETQNAGEKEPLRFSMEISYEKIGASVGIIEQAGKDFRISGDARETLHSDGKTGVHLEGGIRLLTDGEVSFADGKIRLTDASEYTILMELHTDMKLEDPAGKCVEELDAAEEKGFEKLLQEHTEDVRVFFDRMDLVIGEEELSDVPTDERLKRFRNGRADQGLESLMYRYGRYLLIASSRENSPLPTHMGGIWNDNIYCNMGCAQDMHIDMNIQMQYWMSAMCNLPEAYWSLFPWVKDTLVPGGRKTAESTYGARGFSAHIVSNPWGYTALGWEYNWGVWALGGAWAATLLWDYYLYTGDIDFLRDYGYPILKEAAEFAADYLFADEEQGCLMSGPAYSPENQYGVDGKAYFLSLSNTCDILMIREIMTIAVKAEKALGISEDTEEFTEKLAKLPPYKIGEKGQIQEWFYDFEEPIPNHRHTSHLLGLYPFWQIRNDREEDAELINAAKKSIELRYKDYEITSWGMNMLEGYYARMGMGDVALKAFHRTLRELTKPNMVIVMGDESAMWQGTWELDGNTGFTASFTELLVQSREEDVMILPALPGEWKSGKLTGVRLHNGKTADISWKNGELEELVIYSQRNEKAVLHYGNLTKEVMLEAGKCFLLKKNLDMKEESAL